MTPYRASLSSFLPPCYDTPVISEFLTWWGQQLLSLLPARSEARQDQAVFALSGPGQVELTMRRRGRTAALGRFALTGTGLAAMRAALGPRRRDTVLQVAPGMMLEQAAALPLAAERDPARVLRYEMDRLTPFTADELFWTWTTEMRDRARSKLHVRLALVPKALVAPALEALTQAGLRPAALVDAAGHRIGLDASGAGRWWRWGVSALALSCALLAMAAATIPFARQSLDSRRIERRIAASRPAVDRVEALRRGMTTASAGIDVLATQRARVGDPLAVLAALTDILPDDTVLTDLALRQRVLTFSGQSAAAARLIPALAADPGFRNPVFAAPVTRNETTRGEGFSIRVDTF